MDYREFKDLVTLVLKECSTEDSAASIEALYEKDMPPTLRAQMFTVFNALGVLKMDLEGKDLQSCESIKGKIIE